jgi:fumarate reductase flavoprotein subunit
MTEVDVIVLGGGLAGHCAALAAAESGASVLLAEKCDEVGGSTVLSGGFIAFADTPEQRERGLSDTAESLLTDLRTVGGPHLRDDLVRTYAAEQQALHGWLTAKGIRFSEVELGSGQSVARSHATDPGLMIATLGEAAAARPGIEVRTGMTAVSLTRSDPDGPVTGAVFDEGGAVVEVAARGGVVIATGGFSKSPELLRRFVPQQAKSLLVGGSGNVGDGLRMAWKLGADFTDMGEVKGTYGAHATECNNGQEISLIFYRGAIIVNRAGRRFTDESQSYKLTGAAALLQPDPVTWQIFDDGIFRAAAGTARLFDPVPAMNRGLIVKAQTLDELADACGIDAAGLAATVERYNREIATGRESEFGRDGLCHHTGALVPIATAPFYAYPATTTILATYCGLCVDPTARVMDVYEEVIPGLYAAGEVVGGFHGQAYMTGSSLGKAALFGRIAGQQAAKRAASNAQTSATSAA